MNIVTAFEENVRYRADKVAVEHGGRQLTYREFDGLVRRLAGRLKSLGAGPGDLIGVRARDTPEHLAAFLAIGRIGATILPLNWRAVGPELLRIADRLPPRFVLTDDAETLPASLQAVDIADVPDGEPDTTPPAEVAHAALVYGLTSGTTGEPKGIVVTHEQMFGRFCAFSVERVIDRDDRFLIPIPLAFDAGRAISFALLTLGGTILLFTPIFDPLELVETVNAADATAVVLSPNTTRSLLELPAETPLMPTLRAYVSMAGKLQPGERAAIRQRLSPRLIDYYGSTGAGPVAFITSEEDGESPTALGRLTPGVAVEIVDDEHKPVPRGVSGRIRMRGPAVTTSFAGQALSGSDESIRDGWYYPGDLGAFDDRGILHLHGRTADLIKRGGLMIHAQEVEHVLSLHPAVVEAAVVGIPSPSLDEEVVAFVVTRESVDPFDLVKFCRLNLSAHKVPQRIEMLGALPRNTNGKVVKARLRVR